MTEFQPSMGLILCKTRDGVTVKYALRNTGTPTGVAAYVTDARPTEMLDSLPTVQQIEANLSQERENA